MSICPHQRQRSRCKECGGTNVCPHQRQRSDCKECREEADTSMPADLEELDDEYEKEDDEDFEVKPRGRGD